MNARYENGTKETWRGWVWNRLAEILPRGSRVLCLCGDTAGDLPLARKHKFSVVGIDVQRRCVDAFRAEGGTAAQMEIGDAILALQPDGVIIDAMGGITGNSFFKPFLWSLFPKVTVWNLLRGRDPDVEVIRADAQERNRAKLVWNYVLGTSHLFYRDNCLSAQDMRAEYEEKVNIIKTLGRCVIAKGLLLSAAKVGAERLVETCYIPTRVWAMYERDGKPLFYSYRSKDSGCVYDTCLWQNRGFVGLNWNRGSLKDAARLLPLAVRRKAAAAKALVTMGHG
jgi:hypothetical protein